jgi:hypothetical protein
MASAWGSAWDEAWGDSWGTVDAVTPGLRRAHKVTLTGSARQPTLSGRASSDVTIEGVANNNITLEGNDA